MRLMMMKSHFLKRCSLSERLKVNKGTFLWDETLSFLESTFKICDVVGTPYCRNNVLSF